MSNKWTDEEKEFVLTEFKGGKTIEEICKSKKINRSEFAIKCKIYLTIYDQLQNGKEHSDVAIEFNKSKKEIKQIEKEAFEIKNKTDTKTMYTNDGGYKYGENKTQNTIDLNEFHHINRTMNIVLSYYENIERLNKLKKNDLIDEDFYNKLMVKLNNFTFDKEKIIESLILKQENQIQSEKNEEDIPKKNEEDIPKKKEKYYNDKSDNDYITKKYIKRMI